MKLNSIFFTQSRTSNTSELIREHQAGTLIKSINFGKTALVTRIPHKSNKTIADNINFLRYVATAEKSQQSPLYTKTFKNI